MEIVAIETERLRLEPVSRELAKAIVAGNISSVTPGDGWPHADTADGLRRALEYGGPYGWLITRGGLVIGDCGTHGDVNEAGEVEIGYGLAKPYHGEGHGGEVVAALSSWMLDVAGVTRVVARVEPENVASWRALERAGFVREREDAGYAVYVLGGETERGGVARGSALTFRAQPERP